MKHDIFHRCSRRPILIRMACALAVLFIAGLGRNAGVALADDASDAQHVQQMMEGMHGQLAELTESLGGFSDEQKQKLTALESSMADKLKANPKMEPRDVRDQAMAGFREILTPDQQKKFDNMLAESARMMASIVTGSHLKLIGVALMSFANDHQGKLPGNLGALADQKLDPKTYLTGDSKTTVPADFDKLEADQKAEWIDAKTGFTFIAGGKDLSKLGPAVIAYVKPRAAAGPNNFLLADGSVLAEDAVTSEKIITELKDGKNPPPSLDMRLPGPPGLAR